VVAEQDFRPLHPAVVHHCWLLCPASHARQQAPPALMASQQWMSYTASYVASDNGSSATSNEYEEFNNHPSPQPQAGRVRAPARASVIDGMQGGAAAVTSGQARQVGGTTTSARSGGTAPLPPHHQHQRQHQPQHQYQRQHQHLRQPCACPRSCRAMRSLLPHCYTPCWMTAFT
jgi:hypothetical protein